MSSKAGSQSSLSSKALGIASSLMLLQLLSRGVTFALNQALARLASPAVFGTASIQFELLSSTILFLSREGVRNALLRAKSDAGDKTQDNSTMHPSIENISLLPPLFGVPVALFSALLYLYFTPPTTLSQPYFTESVAIYALAAVLVLISEPLYIRAQNDLQFGIRVRAEGSAVILKAVVAVAMIVLGGEEKALLAFALGQAAVREYRFEPKLLRLSIAMTSQSFIKHILTEGDKFAVSMISTLEDQGAYAIASNYGSLAARIVFQPIEESSRVFFSKALASEDAQKGKEVSKKQSAITSAHTALSLLLLFNVHLTLLLVTFAPPYLPTVLKLLLPPRYLLTSAPQILALYPTILLPTMAFNGTLEAFLASTSTPSAMQAHARFLVSASVASVGAVWLLVEYLQWKTTGLVWANSFNLFLRAAWAGWWAWDWFRGNGLAGRDWRQAFPPIPVWLACLLCGTVVRATYPKGGALQGSGWKGIGQEDIKHVGVGIACALLTVAVCFLSQRKR
ncbi:Oligosaccharide translocation protein rft1, partial [Tulasnella sp. 417]